MKNLSFIICIFCFYCRAQNNVPEVDDNFYIKCHELLDDILHKGTSTYCIKKMFDFNNQQKLTSSKLYNEITYFHPLSFKESTNLDDSIKDIKRFKDSSGWLTSSNNGTLKEWNSSLFKKSKIIIVDSYRKEFLYTENDVTYFNIIPLQINLKDNLAMVLYKGAFGLELYAYRFTQGKWYTIGVAKQYKGSKE